MKKIRNYLLMTTIVFAPSLLWAHPGHEHHGTGLELLGHHLVSLIFILVLGAGLFRLAHYLLSKRNPASNNQIS